VECEKNGIFSNTAVAPLAAQMKVVCDMAGLLEANSADFGPAAQSASRVSAGQVAGFRILYI
jgi:hypothetical protein